MRRGNGPWPWLVLILAATMGCGSARDTPEGVARLFMDRYYVAIDLIGAKELCVGLAFTKIEKELELTRGQQITAGTRKPRVRYRLVQQRRAGQSLEVFLFENEIRLMDGGVFRKRCQIALRKREQGWKVSHFRDYDA